LSREERADFAELMILVEVARWAERIVPLVDRMARYDPNDGWTDALREGLEVPPAIALVNDVRSVLKDASGDDGRVARAIASAEEEERCQAELLAALEPFFKANGSIGWSASADALKRVLSERRSTLLVRIARPWIEGA